MTRPKATTKIKQDRKKSAPKYTDPEEVRNLVEVEGLSYEKAGKILGITKQSVWRLCKDYNISHKALDNWIENRARMLASKSRLIHDSLTWEDIKDEKPRDRAVMEGIYLDHEAKARGQVQPRESYINVQINLRGDFAEWQRLGYQPQDVVPIEQLQELELLPVSSSG